MNSFTVRLALVIALAHMACGDVSAFQAPTADKNPPNKQPPPPPLPIWAELDSRAKPIGQLTEQTPVIRHEARPGDSDATVQTIGRLEAAAKDYVLQLRQFNGNRGSRENFLDSARRLLDAQLELASTDPERVAICEQYCNTMGELVGHYRQCLGPMDCGPHGYATRILAERCDAHIRLLRAKGIALPLGFKAPAQFTSPRDESPLAAEPDPYELGDPMPGQYAESRDDSDLVVLLKARANFALEELRIHTRSFQTGRGRYVDLVGALRRRLEAQLDLSPTAEDRIKVFAARHEFTVRLAKLTKARFDAGAIKEQDWTYFQKLVLDSERQLSTAKGKR